MSDILKKEIEKMTGKPMSPSVLLSFERMAQRVIGEEFDKLQQAYEEMYAKVERQIIERLNDAKGDQGEKGDMGEKPVAGVDYPIPKDGIPGTPGRDGKDAKPVDEQKIIKEVTQKVVKEIPVPKDGKNGIDGSPDSPEDIKKKLIELPIKEEWFDYRHIKGLPKSSVGRSIIKGAGSPLAAYDLSASLDGSTKTFTIPANNGIVLITSSSTPFTFRPTTDFTVSGTTLTFTANVEAITMLSSGQTLIVVYVQ